MLLPFDSIARSIDFDQRASVMQLRPWQWEFLLGADGHTRLGDLARSCGIDFDTACDLVHETEALGLVEIVTLTLDAYRASVAQRVTPLGSPSTVAFTSAAFAEPAPVLETEAPVAIAPPRKTVSLSFDALSSMAVDWDTPEVAHAVSSERPVMESLADHPSIGDLPIDFEFPDHMEPLGDRDVTFEPHPADRYDDLFAPTNGHATVHNGVVHDDVAPPLDRAHDVETHELTAHEHVTPLVFSAEPEPPKKSVSFSLSADSFGLPTEPFDTTGFDTHVDSSLEPEPAHVAETPSPKKDDVLLQHFQVEGTHGVSAAHGVPLEDPTADTRTNSDLTGVVLRVLGLKK